MWYINFHLLFLCSCLVRLISLPMPNIMKLHADRIDNIIALNLPQRLANWEGVIFLCYCPVGVFITLTNC